MNLRCKSGDLAIIIYDTPECSSNIGRVVEVRGPVEFNSLYYINVQCWLIKPIHRNLYKVEYTIKGERVVVPKICYWKYPIEHPIGRTKIRCEPVIHFPWRSVHEFACADSRDVEEARRINKMIVEGKASVLPSPFGSIALN